MERVFKLIMPDVFTEKYNELLTQNGDDAVKAFEQIKFTKQEVRFDTVWLNSARNYVKGEHHGFALGLLCASTVVCVGVLSYSIYNQYKKNKQQK